ncbi:transcriptional regulator, AraC family [Lachnospiraceae bacterium KM106-2]|nr:transcriptional regulator, AraC family [Lachnospiraceae bacterium KM106-2]
MNDSHSFSAQLNTLYLDPLPNNTQYLPVRLSPSQTAQKHLLHILAYGEMSAVPPFFCSISGLSSYCLLYTIKGEGTLHINGNNYLLTPHEIAFYYCNTKHELKINEHHTWNFQQYFFNGPSAGIYYSEYHSKHSIVTDISALSHIPHYMDELNINYNRNDLTSELITAMLLTNITTELITEDHAASTSSSIPTYLLKMKQQLETNFHQDISLDELANQYNRSKYRIIRDYTTYFHDTPINYLISCRMRVAKELLISTDLSVTLISYHVGIENVTHFINLFKKTTGVTPLNFRKEHQLHSN